MASPCCKRRRIQASPAPPVLSAVSALRARAVSGMSVGMPYCAARATPATLREVVLPRAGDHNRLMSSAWLDEHRVLCGTRDSSLILVDARGTPTMSDVPLISSSGDDSMQCCGISCMAVNPGRSLVATRGKCPDSLALYALPDLEPIGSTPSTFLYECMASLGWVSNTHIMSSSRSGTVSIWDVNGGTPVETAVDRSMLMFDSLGPDFSLRYRNSGLCVDAATGAAATLSGAGTLSLWDLHGGLRVTASVRIPGCVNCNCLEFCPEQGLYVVGTGSRAAFIDFRTCATVFSVSLGGDIVGGGMWSAAFNDSVLAIGTGVGSVLFFDTRARDFVRHSGVEETDMDTDSSEAVILQTQCSWLSEEGLVSRMLDDARESGRCHTLVNTVHTVCFSPSRSKLFAGGGPWPLGIHGHFASIFQ